MRPWPALLPGGFPEPFRGDGRSVTGGTVTGANDFIRVAGSAFGTYIGDFAGSDEQVIGGNDYLLTTSTLGASLYGDLGVFNGTGLCQGGADVLRANQASIADPRLFNSLIGDVQTVMDGTFVGGADAILGSNAARDWIIGDAENCMAASATGGDDELYGGAGPDTVYGDFVNLLSPTAQCGNDRILGRVYTLRGDRLAEGLAHLDEVESAVRGDYHRITVTTESGHTAWAYQCGEAALLRRRIECGDWLQR